MQRNLYERVEVLFPLKDPELRRRIAQEILPAYLADTRTARILDSDGGFSRQWVRRKSRGISVQEQLMRAAQQGGSPYGTRTAKANGKLAAAVYTVSAGGAASENPTDQSAPQDSLNASV